jgi:hypothetical protein
MTGIDEQIIAAQDEYVSPGPPLAHDVLRAWADELHIMADADRRKCAGMIGADEARIEGQTRQIWIANMMRNLAQTLENQGQRTRVERRATPR